MIYTILNGNGNIKSKDEEIPVKTGDSLLIPCIVAVEIAGKSGFLKISI